MVQVSKHLSITRDTVLFVIGAGAFIYEVLSGGNRANVFFGALSLMGVAAFLRGGTIVANKKNGNGAGAAP